MVLGLALGLEAALQVVALQAVAPPADRLLALFLVNYPAPMRISPYVILMAHTSKLLARLERQLWLHVRGLTPAPARAVTAAG